MKLSIGDKFPINIYSEAALAFRDNEVMLVLNWAGIKSNEVKNVKSGLPQFVVYTQQDIMFLCFRFGTLPWMDVPYTIYLEKGGSYDFDSEIEDGKGYALQVYLVDAVSNKIRAIRLIGLSTELSRKIREVVLAQKQSRKIGKIECDMLVNAIYDSMSTMDMVEVAKETEDKND